MLAKDLGNDCKNPLDHSLVIDLLEYVNTNWSLHQVLELLES